MCPCGYAEESGTRIVSDCEFYKEEQIVFEKVRKIDGCDMQEFDTTYISLIPRTLL